MLKRVLYPFFGFIFFLTVALIADFLHASGDVDSSNKEFIAEIETNIKEEIGRFSTDFHRIEKMLNNGDSLSFFKNKFQNDFLIYTQNNIWFWTNNSLPIHEDLVKSDYDTQVFDKKNGAYLCQKRQVGQAVVIFMLKLQEHYPVTNRYLHSKKLNEKIFGEETLGKIFLAPQNQTFPVSYNQAPLFYLDLTHVSTGYSLGLVFCYFVAIICFIVAVYRLLLYLRTIRKPLYALGTLIISIGALRLFLFYSGFFKRVIPLELFDSSIYASSAFTPSIGDFLLHLLSVTLLVAYLYQQLISSKQYRFMSLFKTGTNYVLMIVFVFVSYYSIELIHFFLNDIYVNSVLNFDITQNLDFSAVEYAYGAIFVGLSLLYLMLNRALLKIFFFLYRKDVNIAVSLWFLGGFIYYVFSSISGHLSVFLFGIHSIYLVLVYSSAIFHEIRSFNFNSYLYIIFTSILTSTIGAYTIYEHTIEKDRIEREKFAEHLIVHDDFQGEFLLNRVTPSIQEEVVRWPDSAGIDYRSAQFKVSELLGHYFDGYEINVLFFDEAGKPLLQKGHLEPFDFYKQKFKQERFKTEYDNLFFVNFYDFGEFSKYLSFVPINQNENNNIRQVVLELTSRHLSPNSVYPEVLSSGMGEGYKLSDKSNYAVFSKYQLLFSAGEYNYNLKDFEQELKHLAGFTHVITNEYEHVLYKGGEDKMVIVSAEDDRFYTIFTNFSFLLLVALVSILLVVLFYILVVDFTNVWPNFSTRIHLYLNFIYLIAIISLSAITISWINEEYDRELKVNFKSKAESIRLNLIETVDQYQQGELDFYGLKEFVRRVRDLSRSDLNVYDTSGRLILSSQPLIFKSEMVSDFVHPNAYHTIISKKHNLSLEEERIGDFDYYNAYIRLSTVDDDRLIGILGIPFFNSERTLSERKIKLFNTILNVFTCVFIVVLLVSYLAFKSITTPLKMLATRIRNTTLSDKNEKIDWRINDEIGWIVQGYNNMITKLEHSKALMSKRQKEDAWKEMAKQVAHEIKNPLTPMRLKIQHLKRVLDSVDKAQMEETMNSLLLQIDTLNDIASSFSDFAKMPTPSYKALNVIECLNEVKQIFDVDTKIICDYSAKEVMVMGDKKFLTRVFNNIILNAIQSVKTGVQPMIIIKVLVGKIAVDVQFIDNGEGIPEEIQRKVFEPNFSTKYSGSGLGLAIAQRGLQHSGGKIWFETEMNKGTTFVVQMPLAYTNVSDYEPTNSQK